MIGRGLPDIGVEKRDRRKWRGLAVRCGDNRAVGLCLPDLAVKHDHLAVKPVEGPDPEVAMLFEFGDRDIAVIHALHQCVMVETWYSVSAPRNQSRLKMFCKTGDRRSPRQ